MFSAEMWGAHPALNTPLSKLGGRWFFANFWCLTCSKNKFLVLTWKRFRKSANVQNKSGTNREPIWKKLTKVLTKSRNCLDTHPKKSGASLEQSTLSPAKRENKTIKSRSNQAQVQTRSRISWTNQEPVQIKSKKQVLNQMRKVCNKSRPSTLHI